MGDVTGIGWTNHTFNAWMGCTEIGPGCDNCYARVLMQDRWKRVEWGTGKPRMRTQPSYWKGPLKWQRMCEADGRTEMVFCNSLSDVFDHEVPQSWREDLFALWRVTPNLIWQVVTKRVSNAPKMLPADWGRGYPNVWMISTICNQEEFERDGPKLLACPAHIRGISYEPALGPLKLGTVPIFSDRSWDWIIGGGESNQGGALGRIDKVEWYENLLHQCRLAGIPYFHKQMARLAPIPDHLMVREFPP